MFDTILVADRGEIAVRVIRACHEAGARAVAVYSTADADSTAVRLADDAVHIGGPPPGESYLNIPNVVGAAIKSGADAIHPGCGFLSEDPWFAEILADHGIVFIGPPPAVTAQLGDKATARSAMAAAGLPVLPGSAPLSSVAEALDAAGEVGFPLMIKASVGRGGRGITVVEDPADLGRAFRRTREEALILFGDPTVYLERRLDPARHVEVQIVCDDHGNAVHLGERDCSVQRRHQKLVEESPSPAVDATLRARMGEASVAGALTVGHRGVGTMEFLLDERGEFWFLECNTRIQVEHPVTEMVTDIDLVAEQLRIAAGEPLSFRQSDVRLRGHAIECRLNAEDAERGFAPTPGRLDVCTPPGGPWVRFDSHCEVGSVVPPHYDSMIAKVIAWAPDRPAALARMARALDETRIGGDGMSVLTGFQRALIDDPRFVRGDVDTGLLADRG